MYSPLALATMAACLTQLASAGTVCLADVMAGNAGGVGGVSNLDLNVFPIQGNPCEDHEEMRVGLDDNPDNPCDMLPWKFEICDIEAELVKVDGESFSFGDDEAGCAVGIKFDGETYEGILLSDDADDNPCTDSCTDNVAAVVYSGRVAFEDLPFCAPADPIKV